MRTEKSSTDSNDSDEDDHDSIQGLDIGSSDDGHDDELDSERESVHSEAEEDVMNIPIRPQRERRPPTYLRDFETNFH